MDAEAAVLLLEADGGTALPVPPAADPAAALLRLAARALRTPAALLARPAAEGAAALTLHDETGG
ncbi:MAG TPA: hypothetical protein VFX29_05905, partial [Longimicrobiaceae bacterium]|nr:hypothetical protein [Longimicrobiaceae bacterium]